MRRRILLSCLLFLLCASALAQGARHRATAPDLAQWIGTHGIPFATTDPVGDDTDLLPLREVIGDALVVGVGEATHGTHEFFTMKHRLFRFLVERMGFTVFSIEASLPECDQINDYVHTGDGDPSALIANMHFWTWNVDEVLDLVLWMRAYNAAHAGGPQLSFRGFDMQFSQQAISGIAAYLQRVDPGNANKDAQLLQCANTSFSAYQVLPASTRNTCHTTVKQAYDAIAAARAPYVAASSADEYERILRYARVVVQFEDDAGHSPLARDPYMAENAEWIVETEHPGEKMMMWAHNGHIGADGGSMGSYLANYWTQRYLRVGFLFDSGDFNSRDAATLVLQKMHVDPAPGGGLEELFRRSREPRLIVDFRNPPPGIFDALYMPRTVWDIGAVYPPGRDVQNFGAVFNAAIWIGETTASRLRPF